MDATGGRIGPNAILQLVPVLRDAAGPELTAHVMAMAGVFEPGVVAGAGVGATLAAVAGLAAGWRRAGGTIEWADPTLAAPVAMVAAVSYWSAQHAGQIMLINRDPGSYLNTARWLERDGSLTADAGDPLFAGISGVRYSSFA